MLAAHILRETVDDILDDPRASFVCLVPTLLGLLLTVLGFTWIAFIAETKVTEWEAVAYALPMVPILIALLLGWLWTAVAWHRMVVLHERPRSLLPAWSGSKLLGYLGRTILVFILVTLASVPLLALTAAIAPDAVISAADGEMSGPMYEYGAAPTDLSARGLIAWLILTAFIYGLSLRLSLILPAGAIGFPLGLREAWTLTRGHFYNLFAPLGVLLALVTLSINLIASVVSFGGVLDIFAMCLEILLGIGVLTRLYMHFAGPQSVAVG